MSALGLSTQSSASSNNEIPAEAPSAPHSPAAHHSPAARPTRTVAIIKNHGLKDRFEIETGITEAGFEIVKERQMEFDVETDPDTLYELFGDEYQSFAEGPVWVYVLERRRAVEVWNTLMGDADPLTARLNAPHSLRAMYGLSAAQNAVMGSADAAAAEVQIGAIFASSPPFPPSELPDVHTASGTSGSLRSETSTVGAAKSPFRARALPATHAAPDIAPRTSRAAALRAGLPVDSAPRRRATRESIAKTFEGVPGHKRATAIAVASTAAPAVAPRMTRAASLRLGQPLPPAPVKVRSVSSGAEKTKATFEGVPGHKRRETIAVASTKPPALAPKTNRSASLRVHKEAAPPSAFNFRAAAAPQTAGGPSRPTTASRPPSVHAHQPARSVQSRATLPARPPPIKRTPATPPPPPPPPPKPVRRPSSVVQGPTIVPRTNKSALLRAAKMAAGTVAGSKPVSKPAPAPRAVRV